MSLGWLVLGPAKVVAAASGPVRSGPVRSLPACHVGMCGGTTLERCAGVCGAVRCELRQTAMCACVRRAVGGCSFRLLRLATAAAAAMIGRPGPARPRG